MKYSMWYFTYFLKLQPIVHCLTLPDSVTCIEPLESDVPAWQHPVYKTGQLAVQRDSMFNISPFYVKGEICNTTVKAR